MSQKIPLAFSLTLFIAIIAITSLSATPSPRHDDLPLPAERSTTVGGGLTASRFLAQTGPVRTCEKSARVCLGRGSPGPSCCSKRCVDVRSDELNCGRCGRRCKSSEICCRGYCVDPSKDERHCGRCNNYCGKGNSCSYGLCGYA